MPSLFADAAASRLSRIQPVTVLVAVIALAIALLGAAPLAQAQGSGVGKNDVGIEGNLLANSPAGAPFGTAGDWLNGPAGPGSGLLNPDGTPVDPARTRHFQDPTGNDPTEQSFTSGNKVSDNPNGYHWSLHGVPQKDDIQHGLFDFIVTPGNGDLWISVAGDRRATNGNSYIDFEFLQNTVTKNPDGTFTSSGPNGGRTVGDLLLTIHLSQGGTQAEFLAQRWQASGSGFSYVGFSPPAGTAFVAANSDSAVVVPYSAFGSTLYAVNAFGEATANLSDLTGSSNCLGFKTVFIRTKASGSATAELKDFIDPFSIAVCADRTPPVISCPPDTTVECDQPTDPTNTGQATAIDECDQQPTISFVDEITPGGCPQESTIHRTWTATDDCGNSATCVQTIQVEDTTPPNIVCPADVTVECGDPTDPDHTGFPKVTDNCNPDPIVTFHDVIIPGDCGAGAAGGADASGKADAAGKARTGVIIIQRTWIGDDSGKAPAGAKICGNTAECTQTITVVDTHAPVIVCPPDTTVECDQPTDPAHTGQATATDTCANGEIDITFTDSVTPGGCPQESTIHRTWTATDVCGNAASCVQTIQVEDTTPPVIVCPADVTVECGDPTDPDHTGFPKVTDNCNPDPIVTFHDVTIPGDCGVGAAGGADASGKADAAGKARTGVIIIQRTWIGDDSGKAPAGAKICGNTAECTQTITVVDSTAPQITCPDDVTLPCGSEPVFGEPQATDICDQTPTIDVVSTVSMPGEGGSTIYTRTWEARDDCGNVSDRCDQAVTVLGCPPSGEQFCSLTQGFYGTEGGTFNNQVVLSLIQSLIGGSPLVVGKPGRSLSIPQSSAQCIIDRLPAGGSAFALPAIGNATLAPPSCQTSPIIPLQQGRFRNVLLGQTISLALNVRLDSDLAGFALVPTFCTQGSLPGPDGLRGTGDDVLDPSSPILVFTIPTDVLTALTSLGLPQTVSGLLELANRSLANQSTGVATRYQINLAVEAINMGFDECRFRVTCPPFAAQGAPAGASAKAAAAAESPAEAAMGGDAAGSPGLPATFELSRSHPNPFNPRTHFTLALPEATRWIVDIYSVGGELVRRFTGEATRPEFVQLEWDGTNGSGTAVAPGVYFYRAQAGSFVATRKTILIK